MSRVARAPVAAQCDGKVSYLEYNHALMVSRRLTDPTNIYRCPHCRHWHIGRTAPGATQRPRRPHEPDDGLDV